MRQSIFVSALATTCLLAQAPPPLERLYPIAIDSSGQPVTDLTVSDFKITDQGKPETILFFRGPRAPDPEPLAPGEYTNRPSGAMAHPIAILFDLFDESRPNWLDAWHSLPKSLPQTELGNSLYFYVINLDGDLVPVHPIGSKSAGDLDKTMTAASAARPAGSNHEDQVKRVYHSMEMVANQLAALPGQGLIVWVTNVMPDVWPPKRCSGDWVECALFIPHLSVTLSQDRVRVNPAYLSGDLQAQIGYDLEQMALLTGGHVYYHRDIATVLQQARRNAAEAYEIAYVPAAANWDNKFHRIHVTCARKGVKLQVKKRYYALPDSRPDEDRQKELFMAALDNTADQTEIGLRLKVSPAAKGVHLDVRFDPADILLREQDGKFSGLATLAVSDRAAPDPDDESGLRRRPIGEPSVSTFKLELTPEQLAAKHRDGITISLDHPVHEGASRIRVVLLDGGRNAVGSLTFPAQ